MIDHNRLHEQLAYYRDLPVQERRVLDAHLAGCAECRATLSAYERQDNALAALPELRPRSGWARPWHTLPLPRGRRLLGRLGDGLVVAGVAALLWMFALQVQYLQQPGLAENGAVPAAAAVEPGLTLPPTRLMPPSPWLPALPWIGGSLLAVGGLFVVGRRNRWPGVAGGVLAALFVFSFVPPLSVVPNPLGVYWRIAGGYSYDPKLPFRNQFVLAGQPEAQLRPHLDALIGQVGLSPLDPVQPLRAYEILRVGVHPTHKDVALVTTRFIYADGTSRIYPVPLLEPALGWGGFWMAGFREDGLERMRSDHLALPGQPFAGEGAPVRLGTARVLDLQPAANRLDEVNPGHWLWTSVRVQRLVWSPDGRSFLAAMELDPGRRQLWRVPLDGSLPILLATGSIGEYGWSPDGQTVVFTRLDPDAAQVNPRRPFAIHALLPVTNAPLRTLATGLETDSLPGLTADGAWFFSDNALWVAPYDGSAARPVAADLGDYAPSGAPRPSPDETRVLFACNKVTCLLLLDDEGQPTEIRTVQGEGTYFPAQATWTADSSQVAVVDTNPNFQSPVRLAVVGRDGEVTLTVQVAPQEATDPPQWTPDNAVVFVQTYPHDGRRLIAVDMPGATVLDLSQEDCDAYYALSPNGLMMLVNNGRGWFWVADVVR